MKKTPPLIGSLHETAAASAHKATNSIARGWYFKGEEMSEDRKRLLKCNYTSNIIANLIGGSFLTGLLLNMQASDSFIGTVTMISTATNMLQFFAPLLLEHFHKRRRLLTLLRAAMYLINVLFIGLIPMFPMERQSRLVIMALSVLFVNMIGALIGPGITVWHLQSIPMRVRSYFYALITMTVGAIVAVCNLLCGKIVDLFSDQNMEYQGLLIVRLIALCLCAYEIYLYFHIKEYPYESAGASFTLRDLVIKPFKEKIYLLTVLVTFLWNFAANTPGSYYTVYLLSNLGVSYSYITLMGCINVPILFLLTPLWRRQLQRLGWFKTLYIGMAFYLCHYILLALVTKQNLFFYPVSLFVAYASAIGINLSFSGIPYVNLPKQNQTASIGFYSTCANLAAFLGVTAGKYFILFTEGRTLHLFGIDMINKQYLVLVTASLMLLSVFGIYRIDRRLKKNPPPAVPE